METLSRGWHKNCILCRGEHAEVRVQADDGYVYYCESCVANIASKLQDLGLWSIPAIQSWVENKTGKDR